jgi:(R,R)-butanediol dehydrogenase/meso-butanediol dehydrogenase/diacetyl reductase
MTKDTMRAARYYARGDIRIETIPKPTLQPGSVAIDVAYCGICGSDLHEYVDGPIFVPTCGRPHPTSKEEAPITLGHEMSGVVAEVGAGVDHVQVGDRVVIEPYIIDPKVDTGPANDAYHLSKGMGFIGLCGRGGGLSERVVVEKRWVHPVGDVPLDEAALIEPLSVAYHAFQRSGGKRGDFALVTGAGPIGLLTAAVLKAEGLTVAISEPSSLRRQKAEETGVADHVFDPRDTNVVEAVQGLSPGGADIAFECTSVQPAFDTLIDAVRPRGVVVVVSIWGVKAQMDMQKLVLKEIDVRGTIAYVHSHPETIKLVQSGKINLKPFITGVIGLDQLVTEGFDTLIHRNETAVKILVDPKK